MRRDAHWPWTPSPWTEGRYVQTTQRQAFLGDTEYLSPNSLLSFALTSLSLCQQLSPTAMLFFSISLTNDCQIEYLSIAHAYSLEWKTNAGRSLVLSFAFSPEPASKAADAQELLTE